MGKRRSSQCRDLTRASLALILQWMLILSALLPYSLPAAHAQASSSVGTIKPTSYPLLFGSSGNVEIDIPKPGIAVRIEIPRDFLQIGGVSVAENDTSFVTSNIRNDYFYYSLVDESKHWTYDWKGTNRAGEPHPSDGPCYKPNFSYYDSNAPYCLEIWNYLNYPNFKQPNSTVNYCALPTQRYVFNCFSAPKFVLLHGLSSPTLAGVYNFTLFVANRTNTLDYPDFVHAWNSTLYVPVSMAYNAGSISGYICDAGSGPPSCVNRIRGEGIVYALQCPAGNPCSSTAPIVARAYVNQSLCQPNFAQCGLFDLTGLAPGSYLVEGSAGVDRGVAYSLTLLGYPSPSTVSVSANEVTTTPLPLRRSPLVCGSISYYNTKLNLIRSLSDQPYLLAAGFRSNPNYNLNITVEGTDSAGHTFRYLGVSTDTTTDTFNLTTGVGVEYVGTDPYGTEFAGLPAPEDIGPGGYTLTVNVYVSGYVERTAESAPITQSPGTTTPSCSPLNQPTVAPNPVGLVMGGVITGTLQFCNTYQGCTLESPDAAERSLPLSPSTIGQLPDSLFGGNILIEAYDSTGLLRGVTVLNGTLANGQTSYADSSSLSFYVIGFSEYYNHSLSGVWHAYAPDFGHDYGLLDGQYSLDVFVRGYELTSASPISIVSGSNQTVTAIMTRGGAFEVTVGSYDNRFGSIAIQAQLRWRFLNSTIPVEARVYFYGSTGTVGYVDRIMETGVLNGVDTNMFTVGFAGQNWSLREIWFYGFIPTYITNDNYTIEAYTLGYVPQFGGGLSFPNELVGFDQAFVVLFIANELDISVPLFSSPQSFTQTPEYDHAIGQAYSGQLAGAETANLTSGIATPGFDIYGFGGMQLSNVTECQTNVLLRGTQPICGQGHFFYVDPAGARNFDFGMGIGNYTAQVPEFGFNFHFLQAFTPPTVSFTDLFLQSGVVFSMFQMAIITQGAASLVQGFCGGTCLANPPSQISPLSWAQVQASNSTYSRSISTSDGSYDGVGALFVPGGTYTVTFSDIQYQSQAYNVTVGWGSSQSLTPNPPLCPTGTTC